MKHVKTFSKARPKQAFALNFGGLGTLLFNMADTLFPNPAEIQQKKEDKEQEEQT